jgi:hypothetical protein
MSTRCPDCHADADGLMRRDGTLRAHRRPVLIRGGIASADCTGVGRAPEPTPIPTWIAEAFR